MMPAFCFPAAGWRPSARSGQFFRGGCADGVRPVCRGLSHDAQMDPDRNRLCPDPRHDDVADLPAAGRRAGRLDAQQADGPRRARCSVIIAAALLLAMQPQQLPVLIAQMLHGFASCVITPGDRGHQPASGRATPRWASGWDETHATRPIGNGLAAAVMGATGAYFSSRFVFLLTAAPVRAGAGGAVVDRGGAACADPNHQPGHGSDRPETPFGRSATADLRDLRVAVPLVECRDAAAGRRGGNDAGRPLRQHHHRSLHRGAASRGRTDVALGWARGGADRPQAASAAGLGRVAREGIAARGAAGILAAGRRSSRQRSKRRGFRRSIALAGRRSHHWHRAF